jgi:NifU-like protein involved in Fe-S cluster formation
VTPAADPYGPEVRALFRAPEHAGTLAGGRVAHARGQGVEVELSMLCDGSRIDVLRFRAYGCPHLLAAAEAFCRDFEGRQLAELNWYSAVETVNSLSVPVEKTGRILVLEDAVRLLGT